MSRAEAVGEAAAAPGRSVPPGLGSAAREALRGFYFNSWRFVAANLVWGIGLVALYLVSLGWPLLGLILAPLLALPTVGLFRLAALVARGEPASFWDAWAAWRAFLRPTLLVGIGATVAGAVLLVNVGGGLLTGTALGWALATFAAWGLVLLWLVTLGLWPVLTDPHRASDGAPAGLRSSLRLAALLVLAHPARMAALGFVCALLLALSTVAFAALLTVSVGFVALLCCHSVLPAADRLEARLATR